MFKEHFQSFYMPRMDTGFWKAVDIVERQPEQWKREILDAAKELFLSKGYEETAVSDIMERAGVTAPFGRNMQKSFPNCSR